MLLVTGTLAKPIVEKYSSRGKVKAEVVSLSAQVAALMSPGYIASQLKLMDLSKFDTILVPGMIGGDTSVITREVGVKTFKGPKHAADIPLVLESLGRTELSTLEPACDLLRDEARKRALAELESIYRRSDSSAKRSGVICIGRNSRTVCVGRDLPMRVLAEIVDAPLLDSDEIGNRARYYAESGADIVDIGMMSGGGHPQEAKRAVRAAKAAVSTPVSIDTVDLEEIHAAIEEGADMVLSIDAGNMAELSKSERDIPVVVTPGTRTHKVPIQIRQRLKQLEVNMRRARQLGFRRIIADPVLSPILMPHLVESLLAFYKFRKRNPAVPMLFGAGNVTELVDGDSPGANLVLAGIGAELGANILLTTEKSDKTYGCVRELSTAVRIVTLAHRRSSAPKDVGLDLLMLKEKRKREEASIDEEDARNLRAIEARKYTHDPLGCFKIALDRNRKEIIVGHFSYGGASPNVIIRGTDPLAIIARIIEQDLISRLDHTAYLGLELEKAKTALKLGRSYVQDIELF